MAKKTANLGRALKSIRARLGLSLHEVSNITGLAVSSLSKVENGRMSLTYDKLVQLSEGLSVPISDFFDCAAGVQEMDKPPVTGRRSVNRSNDGMVVDTGQYSHTFLSTEIHNKQFAPIHGEIRAKSVEDFEDWVRHPGEEFVYVLSGELVVHTEYYQPVNLKAGDSVWLDSSMGHLYTTATDEPCKVIAVCTLPEADLIKAMVPLYGEGQEAPKITSLHSPKPGAKGKAV